MQHFVLVYHYVSDYMARRDAVRPQHLARIGKAIKEGRILVAGVLPDEPAALIVFYTENADEVHVFAQSDPYNAAGLIDSYEVRPWTVAAGVEDFVHPALGKNE